MRQSERREVGKIVAGTTASTIETPYCWRCHAPGVSGGACRWCKAGGGGFEMLRALHSYAGHAAKTVQEAKKSEKPARDMGGELGTYARTLRWPVDMVVPVPLHRDARQARGFNQARAVAEGVARALDVPLRPDVAQRPKATLKQRDQQSIDGRIENMRGAFKARGPGLDGASPLVVDDVATTGQTLNNLALALRRGGAARVYALVYARTAPGSEDDPVTYIANPQGGGNDDAKRVDRQDRPAAAPADGEAGGTPSR